MFAATQWGQKTNDVDENGNTVYGTSGVAQDVNRYRQMGADVPATGPAIDQTRTDDDRAMGMGSLDMLRQTAQGQTPSAAERFGAQQTQDAQNAQYSMGASVRGGAMARAAAARSAQMGAATVGQVGNQQRAATRAGEMAGARDAYFGAASAQRGQDLGLASEQAKLDMGQRAQNEQRDQFYEGLGFGTKKAALDSALGRSASDEAASNAGRTQALNEQQAGRQRTDQMISAGTGAAMGAVSGYAQSQQSTPAHRPGLSTYNDPYGTGSDERLKQDVMPLYEPEGQELHVNDAGKGYLASNEPDAVSGASLSGPTPRYSSAPAATAPATQPVAVSMKPQADGPAPASTKAKAQPKERKPSYAELKRLADEMMGAQNAQIAGHLARGPAVGYNAGDHPMAEANRSMAPSTYAYKPEHAPAEGQAPGEVNVGPMAQQMAADPVASTAIVQRPDGMLSIDKSKGLKLVMGGLSGLQREVDEMKRQRGIAP